MPLTPFHLAIPVHDLAAARRFYGGVLGCPEGRSADRWVDFDLYGHQLVCHVVEGMRSATVSGDNADGHNRVDGHDVPVPHFGVVLEMPDWNALSERLRAAGMAFVVEPHLRFAGQPGEQATLFLLDPSGNALEFKAFTDIEGQLFAQ
ncbi:MAG: VOC family protein [Luteimonas sp.]